MNNKTQPIAPLEPIKTTDSVKKTETAQATHPPKVSGQTMAHKAGATRPAEHVGPAGHAEAVPHDVAAVAAVAEERGRDAVERIEGTPPPVATHAATAHVSVTLRPHVLTHINEAMWKVTEELRQARANDIEDVLRKHPEAAVALARIFLLSGGASALEALRQGRSHFETELPKYVKATPDEPEI